MEFPRSSAISSSSCAKLPFLFPSSSSGRRRRRRPLKRFIDETRFSQDWMLCSLVPRRSWGSKRRRSAPAVLPSGWRCKKKMKRTTAPSSPAAAVFWPHYRISWHMPELYEWNVESPRTHNGELQKQYCLYGQITTE